MLNEFSEDFSLKVRDERCKIISREEIKESKNKFDQWINELDCLPKDYKVKPKDNLFPDINLWPLAWFCRAIEIVSKGMNKNEGHIDSPLFLLACEFFLKGMWLCQFEGCRKVAYGGYMNRDERDSINRNLKKLSHNLISIIDECEKLYREDEKSLNFLKRLNAIIRMYYYPLYKNDIDWAAVRYPVRYYDDTKKKSLTRGYLPFPSQWMLKTLLGHQRNHLINKWGMKPSKKEDDKKNKED